MEISNDIRMQVSLATDEATLARNAKIENVTSDSQKTELAKAARGFEAIFVNMMLKEMKTGMLDEKGDGGFGSDTLMSYMDMQLSDQISQTGSGIGLAEQIYSQLTGGDKLPSITQIRPEKNLPLKSQMQQLGITNKTADSMPTSGDKTEQVSGNFMDRVSNRLEKYQSIITEASQKYGVDESIIKGIITAESAGKNEAKSGVGAKGLMQLMDATAKELGVNNPYDPEQNIMAGTKYIKRQLDTFGSLDKALAAYNAGAGNVRKYGGIPPFKETQNYVVKVKQYAQIYRT